MPSLRILYSLSVIKVAIAGKKTSKKGEFDFKLIKSLVYRKKEAYKSGISIKK